MSMKWLWAILLLGCAAGVQAQANPVKWEFSAKKIKKGEYELTFKASIDEDWAIYSQHLDGDGPVPTSFAFDAMPDGATLVGEVEEHSEHKIEGLDPIFEMQIVKYKEEVRFVQNVTITGNTTLTGTVNYMSCNSETCLPPKDVKFSFTLKK